MKFKIEISISAGANTMDEAVNRIIGLSIPGFKLTYLSICENDEHDARLRIAEENTPPETTQAEAETLAAAEVVAQTEKPAPKSRARSAKSAADPAPAPASSAPSTPAAPAMAPASAPASAVKAPTHADLRAVLVPIASSGADGSKRVTKFIRDAGYLGTVDTIPVADLPALIAKAKEVFAS